MAKQNAQLLCCASPLVTAAYIPVRLIPRGLRRLALERSALPLHLDLNMIPNRLQPVQVPMGDTGNIRIKCLNMNHQGCAC